MGAASVGTDGGGGRDDVRSSAPGPALGFVGQVKLESLVSGLLKIFKGSGVLVITIASDPEVTGFEEQHNGKEGRDVGNELPG